MAIINEKSISLTAMASNFKEDNISRDMLLHTLIQNGFLEDIRTITDKGLKEGIEYAYGENNAKWPVYSKAIQERLCQNIPWMLKHFPELSLSNNSNKKKGTEKNNARTNNNDKKNPLPIATSETYKYLGLSNFVILDTETTGLKNDDEVIELSIVNMEGNELYHSYYYPEKEVDPFAAKVNHLTKTKLEGNKKLTEEEWNVINSIINGKRILGHNIEFDQRLILQTVEKNGGNVSSINSAFKNCIDTKKLAQKWIKNRSYSLNNLTTLIGISREEQHNSTDDCKMTLEFINRLEDIIMIKTEYNFIKF